MYHSYQNEEENVLEYATQQIISKSFNIQGLPLGSITAENIDYFFVYYNALNDYGMVLLEVYMELIEQSQRNMGLLKSQTIIILIVSATIMFFASILLTLFLNKTLNTRQEILKIFLDIPEKTAKLFYQKCETFLQQIGSNEDDEVASDIEQYMDDKASQEENVSLLGRKKKRFKNNEHKNFGFFIKMMIISAVIESYFVLVYFLDQSNLTRKVALPYSPP